MVKITQTHTDTNDKMKHKALTCRFLEVNKDFNLVPFYYKKYIFQNYIKESTCKTGGNYGYHHM